MRQSLKVAESQAKSFEAAIAKVQEQYLKELQDAIRTLETSGGVIASNAENIQRLAQLTNELEIALNDAGFEELISEELIKTKRLAGLTIEDVPKAITGGVAVSFGEVDERTLNNLLQIQYKALEDIGKNLDLAIVDELLGVLPEPGQKKGDPLQKPHCILKDNLAGCQRSEERIVEIGVCWLGDR